MVVNVVQLLALKSRCLLEGAPWEAIDWPGVISVGALVVRTDLLAAVCIFRPPLCQAAEMLSRTIGLLVDRICPGQMVWLLQVAQFTLCHGMCYES